MSQIVETSGVNLILKVFHPPAFIPLDPQLFQIQLRIQTTVKRPVSRQSHILLALNLSPPPLRHQQPKRRRSGIETRAEPHFGRDERFQVPLKFGQSPRGQRGEEFLLLYRCTQGLLAHQVFWTTAGWILLVLRRREAWRGKSELGDAGSKPCFARMKLMRVINRVRVRLKTKRRMRCIEVPMTAMRMMGMFDCWVTRGNSLTTRQTTFFFSEFFVLCFFSSASENISKIKA